MRLKTTPHESIAFPCTVPTGFRNRLSYAVCKIDGPKAGLGARQRQGVPVLAYTGANGSGKSAYEVYDVLPTLLTGRRWECDKEWHYHSQEGIFSGERYVLGTVQMFDPDTEVLYTRHHPRFVPLRNFGQLLRAEHCEVVLDEVTGVMSSRQSQSLPVQVENLIVQMRRRDCTVRWSTPDFSAADIRLRQVTQGVVYCTGGMRVASPVPGRTWRDAQNLGACCYDRAAFDTFTHGQRDKLRAQGAQSIWRPGHVLERVYDTLAEVYALGIATDGGMCLACGGQRSRAKCHCPSDEGAIPEGFLEEVTSSGTRRRVAATVAAANGADSDRPQRVSARTGAPEPLAADPPASIGTRSP
jgi:hypothetical protein